MNNTDKKITELDGYIATATNALVQAKELYSALATWDAKIVNKKFFEYHFSCRNEKGELEKEWKGNTKTRFYFSDKSYEWEKYAKKIYLKYPEYIKIPTTQTIDVCNAVKGEIEQLEANITHWNDEIKNLKQIDEAAIIKDLLAVYKKHGKPEIWRDILDNYEVKYPNEE